jgi:uncharacterized protein (TIGR01777 family)
MFQNIQKPNFVSRILKKHKVSKILIAGGTGMVGSYITRLLLNEGQEVVYLSRTAGIKAGIKSYEWNPQRGYIDPLALEGVDAVINLAGAGIADHRWTKTYKKELYNSRILSTRLLVETINKSQVKPEVFISASGMGFYGLNTPKPAVESDRPGDDFLAGLCDHWEQEAARLSGSRLVVLRLGVVLAKKGGFIPRVSRLIRFGIGSVLGSGRQVMSWIHIADLGALVLKAINDKQMEGTYNAVSPDPCSNKEITYGMARKLNRVIILPPAPAFALKLILGEITSSLLANQEVSSAKTEDTGFVFRYPRLQNALDNLLPDTK